MLQYSSAEYDIYLIPSYLTLKTPMSGCTSLHYCQNKWPFQFIYPFTTDIACSNIKVHKITCILILCILLLDSHVSVHNFTWKFTLLLLSTKMYSTSIINVIPYSYFPPFFCNLHSMLPYFRPQLGMSIHN